MRSSIRPGLTLVEVLVTLTILAILFVLLLASVQQVRSPGRRRQCQDHLKNVVLGMHNYAMSHRGQLPGARNKTSGEEGYKYNARFSMFADVSPFIEFDSVFDRLNYKSPEPFVITVGMSSNGKYINEILPPNTPASKPGEFPPSDTGGWIVGAKDTLTANRHYEALQAVVPIFQCPADDTLTAAKSSLNYAPVVTAGLPNGLGGGRFLQPDGGLVEAIWPPDDDAVMSAPVPATLVSPGAEGAGQAFFDRLNPITLDFLTNADGTSNTVGLVERLKGRAVSGKFDTAKNVALVGAPGVNGYVIGRDGLIASDNSAQVAACQRLVAGGAAPSTTDDNALAGALYFQHTCAWLGCANMMAPPNTPVCRGSNSLLAQTGIAGPSSNHGAGANVGVMDGTVRFLTDETDLKVMHAYGSPAGRENHPDTNN